MASNGWARRSKIVPGMSVSEALAIQRDFRLFAYEPENDYQALVELAQEAWQFSPMVGLESLDSQPWAGRFLHQPQAFFLEANGLTHLFDGPMRLLEQIQGWLFEKGYLACLAMAPSVGAAWALANYSYRHQVTGLLTANATKEQDEKSASHDSRQHEALASGNTAKEREVKSASLSGLSLGNPSVGLAQAKDLSPIVISSEEDLPARIDRLPIEALRLDSPTAQTLHRLGVRTIDALSRLPRAGLANRLGEKLLHRLDEARHAKPQPIVSLKESMTCSFEWPLEVPTACRATIEEVVRRLTHQLCQKLKQHGQGALRVVSRLAVEQGPAHLLSLSLYRATAEESHLTSLLLGQLETLQSLSKPVTSVNLTVTLMAPLVWKQQELFDTENHSYRQPLAYLIDSLAGRLGRQQVVAAKLVKNPQPEFTCQWQPLTGQPLGRRQRLVTSKLKLDNPSRLEPSYQDHGRRPTRLYPVPRPLKILQFDSHGLPQQIDCQGESYAILQSFGPERLESGWWAGACHRRDYYRVVTQAGAWLWIYRELQEKKWFLHGIF
jgi:protein ImuB